MKSFRGSGLGPGCAALTPCQAVVMNFPHMGG